MATFTIVRAFWFLLVVSLLCSSTQSKTIRAHRRRHAVTNLHSHILRQDNIYPVLGVRGHGINNTAPRLEIRELQRNPDLFNLYLLGLQRWQNISQDDKLSYFQIAGTYASTKYVREVMLQTDHYKVYMAVRSYLGMAFPDVHSRQRGIKKATVTIAVICFLLGIVPSWL
ncbi:hypothetical protein B5807_11082 [Epicoccum nigrum]|uniref:Uncharacterized protein n=1 Tax=Epicoccum nigrum TaxID=105696 RepID=A0A1Y2LJS6_EPING|nr:hypothetical protein B5807_11082 [Epicoccum nigrum]